MLLPKLERMEAREKAARCQKLRDRTALDDFSSIEHDHFIGVLNRADPMGDDQYGSAASELLKGILDDCFRDEIERICRLIENQNLWISDEGARQCHPLPLTAREPKTPIPENRFEPLWQILDELQRMRPAGPLQAFFAGGTDLPAAHLFCHPPIKKLDVLAYYRDLVTPPG